MSCLLDAAPDGNLAKVQRFSRGGVNIHEVDVTDGWNTLTNADSNGHGFIVRWAVKECACRDLSIKASLAPPLADAVSI
jgi:hypothetical protein